MLAAVATFSFISCKKYPEDDKRSWSTPKRRLDGDWSFSKYTINGQDSTQNYKCGNLVRFDDDDFAWFDGLSQCDRGNWELIDDKSAIKLSYTLLSSGSKTFYPTGGHTIWTIQQLTKKEAQLETVYNGTTYRIYLIAQ